MKNVYGYIRVSTVKQGEGVSLIAQKEAIERYANQYALNIVQWFEEKETAAKLGRPLFDNMMKLLKTKKADGVIIHKIDRGARNLKDWADLGNLIDQGVEVHFAHESLDLQARGGRLSADIQAVIAADYIRNLRQEAIKGIYGRLKQGIYPFQAPIGYLDTGAGKFKTIDPVRAPLVQKAFELYASKKYTLRTLCVKLNELGLRNIKETKIKINGLASVLKNPFYTGIIRVKGGTFDGGHEPLISVALFKQVQAILKGNTNQKVKKHDFKFRRAISCKHCSLALIAERQKGTVYYRCHTKGCVTKGMRENTLENFLLKSFKVCELFPEEYHGLYNLLQETEREWIATQNDLVNSITLKHGQLQQKLERLTDCYLENGIDKETFDKRKEILLLELKEKENAKNEFSKGKDWILKKTGKFLELGKNLTETYRIGNLEEQRDLLQIVTSNLVVDGKKLIISMRSPFLELQNRGYNHCGGPIQDTSRTKQAKNAGSAKSNVLPVAIKSYPNELIFSEVNTSPIIGPPLSKKKLRVLFGRILETVKDWPGNYDEEANILDDS